MKRVWQGHCWYPTVRALVLCLLAGLLAVPTPMVGAEDAVAESAPQPFAGYPNFVDLARILNLQ
ncbi:MAG TPA: hypothetical protein PLG17_02575 [Thermodesulfobacteriota bacterium]|nr:hypothetical protein [Thermodesulfobacteriota bacterium]